MTCLLNVSYIKDTNHLLRKIKEAGQLPEGTGLSTINVTGLYQKFHMMKVLLS